MAMTPTRKTYIEGTINHVELRLARELLGFTISYVSQRADVRTDLLRQYELGAGRPDFSTLEKIANVYDMKAEDFLTPASMVMLSRIEGALYRYTQKLDFAKNHAAALGWFDRLAGLINIRHEREAMQHEEEMLKLQIKLEEAKRDGEEGNLKAIESDVDQRETQEHILSEGISEDRDPEGGQEVGTIQEP